jgi:hypothetical protein
MRAPSPPDPVATANAQATMNLETAKAQQLINMTNQVTPYGTLTYNKTGEESFLRSGAGGGSDSALGGAGGTGGERVVIPRYTATVKLSPAQQQLLDLSNQTMTNIGRIGVEQSNRIRGVLNSPMNYNAAPQARDANRILAPVFQRVSQSPNLSNSFGSAGAVNRNIANSGAINRAFGDAGDVTRMLDRTGNVQTGIGPLGAIQNAFDRGGDVQQNIVNAGPVATTFDQAGDVTRSIGASDFSADRQRYESALLKRLSPQIENDRRALQTQLASQGIRLGSQAYNDAMFNQERQVNDARLGAILNAGTEQERMFGMDAARGQFANAAQQQAYNQALGRGQFQNAGQQQAYNQALGAGTFANQAQAQRFGQNATQAAFNNQAQAQDYDQRLGAGTFANQAQAQQFGQAQARAGLANSAQQQAYDQLVGRTNLANQAQAQQFAQNATRAQFQNAGQQQAYDQLQGRANFRNQSITQNLNNRITGANFNNAAGQQNFQNQTTQYQLSQAQRQAKIQELTALRNQPINEISALVSGSQVQNPNFVNTPTSQVAGVDYTGLVNQQYQAQMQRANAGMGGLFGLLSAGVTAFSDRRLKTDIAKVGKLDNGLNVYRYRMKAGGPTVIGLMADEVQEKLPHAVGESFGFKTVNYAIATEAA